MENTLLDDIVIKIEIENAKQTPSRSDTRRKEKLCFEGMEEYCRIRQENPKPSYEETKHIFFVARVLGDMSREGLGKRINKFINKNKEYLPDELITTLKEKAPSMDTG